MKVLPVSARRIALLAGLGISLAASLLAATERPAPAPQPRATSATLKVYADRTIRKVDDRHFALNTAVWDNAFKDPKTLSYLKDLKIRTLRFPGGSTSDTYDWKTGRSYQTGTRTLNNWAWANSFDDFASVALALKARVFLVANYGSGNSDQAAAWVAYSKKKKYGFKYWEIGNENYGSWEEDIRARKWDPVTYATEAKKYIAKMKAADSTVKVGVVVVTGEDSYSSVSRTAVKNPRTGLFHKGWTPVLLATLKSLKVTPDFLIYHRYEQNPKDAWNAGENDAFLLQSAKTWADDAADLRRQLVDYLGSTAAAKVELVCTENNSVSYNPGKQTTSLVNGLFLADSFGRITQTEFNSLVWWGLHNSQEKANNNADSLYGWRKYGDYGVLSPGNGRYPTYYVMKMLASFARSGDRVVKTSSSTSLLACYAVRRANGKLTMLVINKSPTTTYSASVALSGFTPASKATALRYGKAQDEAARKKASGQAPASSTLSSIKKTSTVSFAPYSVSLITFSPKS